MNSLFAGIISQAESKAKQIIEKAEIEAKDIISQSRVKAAKEVEKEQKSLVKRLETYDIKEESVKRNNVRIKALKQLDSGYNALMSQADLAFEKLYLDKDRYEPILISWICEAILGLGLTEAKVAYYAKCPVSEKMLDQAKKDLKEKFDITVQLSLDTKRTSTFGVTLTSLDDRISYNNQLDTRLRRKTKDVKKIVQEFTCKVE